MLTKKWKEETILTSNNIVPRQGDAIGTEVASL